MGKTFNPPDAFADALDTFKVSAFRFEGLQTYLIEEEREEFQRFLTGWIPKTCPDGLKDWCSDIAAATQSGKTYQRVRTIIFPLNEYTRFEVICGYQFSEPAGEVIQLLEEAPLKTGNTVTVIPDFWIFDDTLCFVMDYDQAGAFLGVRKVADNQLPFFVLIKHKALEQSIDLRHSKTWQQLFPSA